MTCEQTIKNASMANNEARAVSQTGTVKGNKNKMLIKFGQTKYKVKFGQTKKSELSLYYN
jgi:hypothetical protein